MRHTKKWIHCLPVNSNLTGHPGFSLAKSDNSWHSVMLKLGLRPQSLTLHGPQHPSPQMLGPRCRSSNISQLPQWPWVPVSYCELGDFFYSFQHWLYRFLLAATFYLGFLCDRCGMKWLSAIRQKYFNYFMYATILQLRTVLCHPMEHRGVNSLKSTERQGNMQEQVLTTYTSAMLPISKKGSFLFCIERDGFFKDRQTSPSFH